MMPKVTPPLRTIMKLGFPKHSYHTVFKRLLQEGKWKRIIHCGKLWQIRCWKRIAGQKNTILLKIVIDALAQK